MLGFIYSCNSCRGSAPDWWVWEPILISVCVTHEMNVGTSRASGSDRRVAALSPIVHSFLPLLILLPLPLSLSFSVTFTREEWALSCWATLVHLYQPSASPGKSALDKREKKTKSSLFGSSLCPFSSPPCTHTAIGYKQMYAGSVCMYTDAHGDAFKARCCRFETRRQVHSPLLCLHIVNKANRRNRALSTSVCSQWWQSGGKKAFSQ